MNQLPSISDAFKEVVKATELALIADTSLNWGYLPKKLYFLHGNVKEIMAVLQSYTNAPEPLKNQKYPLIALFRDIKENVYPMKDGLSTSFKARIAIFTMTTRTYRADQREQENFKPILIPIFEEFVRQLSKSKAFGSPSVKDLAIVKWDCYFYGADAAMKNVLNDYVDAIEIESMSLNLKNIC